MTGRPIIFGGHGVRGILADEKTQTRRVVKPTKRLRIPPPPDGALWSVRCESWMQIDPSAAARQCPYGAPGDRLWVKETFDDSWGVVYYAANWRHDAERVREVEQRGVRWRSPIFMPRWASRIELVIVEVRVERLQDISEEDALAEGVERAHGDLFGVQGLIPFEHHYPQDAFAALWDSINVERGFGWNTNPWVWALSFKRIEAKERAA